MTQLVRKNFEIAQHQWVLTEPQIEALRVLSLHYKFRLALGEIILLDGGWYVTHSGLLGLAARSQCRGINVQQVPKFCDSSLSQWVFKATVYKRDSRCGFTGYGDANPSNVSPLVRGAEMRVAESRAVNRALRKAYGIGFCSVEELGWQPKTYSGSDQPKTASGSNGNGHRGNVSLRDRLCLLIRQHHLDANLVKAYAADFCGTPNLRDASREQIEQFVTNLSDWAAKDRPALLCKLNSYFPQEVMS